MEQVIIYIQAFNAETTIERALNSILNQTHEKWICYCVDNGSIDKTGSIIEKYAHIDGRIRLERLERNNIWYFFDALPSILDNYNKGYFTVLDADDEYMPTFLEKMLFEIDMNDLEIASCGSEFINASTNTVISARKSNNTLILEGESFGGYFASYHQFMRTIWAKLYHIPLIKQCNFDLSRQVCYGGDTIFAIETFRHAKRAGIFPEILHRYYMSPKSSSYQFMPLRIDSDRLLFEFTCDFLLYKAGYLTSRNESFLLIVYMNAIKDTVAVLLNSQASIETKISGVIDIFSHKYTEKIIAKNDWDLTLFSLASVLGQRQDFFSDVINWMFALDEVPDALVQGYCDVGERLCDAIGEPEGALSFRGIREVYEMRQN